MRKKCGAPAFYGLLRDIDAALTTETRSRWYLDTAVGKERWDAIVNVQRKAFYLANQLEMPPNRGVAAGRRFEPAPVQHRDAPVFVTDQFRLLQPTTASSPIVATSTIAPSAMTVVIEQTPPFGTYT